jgi:mannose-6-phosphate isomerase-like protein (cupin superfamily)
MTMEHVGVPFHTGPGEGPRVWHLGALLTFKATTEATAGRFWAKELLAPRGVAVPRHVHTHEDEVFYVLDGEVSVHIGDDVIHAEGGSLLWGPRAVPHAFRIESETAKVLVFSMPGGYDRFFFDTGTPATAPTLPPPATDPPDLDALVAAAGKHGVDIVGPPPGPPPR